MVSLQVGPFARRLRGLLYKNILVAIVRRPVGFFFFIYGIPIAILAILLSIPEFTSSSDKYGSALPEPIKSPLSDVVDKKLIVVQPPHLGPDVQPVVDALTKDIDPSLLRFETDDAALPNLCVSDLRGVSPCFASVTFLDSPRTTKDVPSRYQFSDTEDEQGSRNRTWSYAVRFDPARSHGRFDATTHDNTAEKFQLPLQLALNRAITNLSSTTPPEAFGFTQSTQEANDKEERKDAVELMSMYIVFALFTGYLFIVYRHTSLITAERDSGMSQLIDSMGGGSTATARVLSWLILFDLYTLPVSIISGVLFSQLLLPSASLGLLIGWQIMLGLSVNGATVFASAFFAKSRVSAVYVLGGFLLLALGAQVNACEWDPLPGPETPYSLALLFPSANFVYFVMQSCVWELLGQSPELGVQPRLPDPKALPQVASYKITQGTMLYFLVAQIIAYPLLAIVVEKAMHGIDFRSRTFQGHKDTESTGAVAEASNLNKEFVPNLLEKIFCCGRRRPVHAVNGVSFQGHRGQMLCLVGPNGSGKTTTLHMMAGFLKPSSGTVALGASPSQVGICPQRNTLWDELTVDEHLYIWNQIKAAHETPSDRAQLVDSCDLSAKRHCRSGTLSGGQKRKLQLACMFIGGSSICLIDECTSGLDPLSRRVIWEMLLEQRARRSIILTTHFLDEVDVLADHIVILTKGRIRCQGAAAELKTRYGGGYRVLVPREAAATVAFVDAPYPSETHQDRLVYTTPDSSSAARLASLLAAAGVEDVGIGGPQFEDVFLRVAGEDDTYNKSSSTTPRQQFHDFELESARVLPFGAQLWILFRKRITVLQRFWFPYLLVVAAPIIITSQLNGLVEDYSPGECADLNSDVYLPYYSTLLYDQYCDSSGEASYGCEAVVVAPQSANRTLHGMFEDGFSDLASIDNESYDKWAHVEEGRQQLLDRTVKDRGQAAGAVFIGEKDEASVIGFRIAEGGSTDSATEMLNLWTEMESGTAINAAFGQFSDNAVVSTHIIKYMLYQD